MSYFAPGARMAVLRAHKYYLAPVCFSVTAAMTGILLLYVVAAWNPLTVLIATLLLGITLVTFYPSLRSAVSDQSFDLFEARHVFVLYFFLQYGLNTAVLLWEGEGPLIGNIHWFMDYIAQALVLALLGIACFQGGYALKPRWLHSMVRRLPRPAWPRRSVAWGLAVAAGYATAVGGFLYLMELEGGILYYVTHIDEIRDQRLLGRGTFYFLSSTASVAWLLSCAVAIRVRGCIPSWHKALWGALILGYLGMGFRLMAVFMALQYLLLRHYLIERYRVRLRYVPILLLALFSMNLYQIYRGVSPSRIGDTLDELQIQLENPRHRTGLFVGVFARFEGTENMVRILQVSESVDFDLGRTLVRDLVVFPIPRLLWPRKPEPGALQLWNRVYFYGTVAEGAYGNRVPTLLGQLYANAGVPGIVLGMFVMGLLVRSAYEYLKADTSRSAVVVYAVIFCFVFGVNEILEPHLQLLIVRATALAGMFTLVYLTRGVRGTAADSRLSAPLLGHHKGKPQ